MPSLLASAAPGFEPITGYVLREKLGAGGYGEVWLADAPGGLKKAIKFVFGTIDEDRAAGELRSLQRIRRVNHPFILSLERIEIVDGQLIIVTELADGSLFDRFRDYRDNGQAGIPRDRLLEYLRDSADALDFLCNKHDLQHLDVKPANLLLVADRVKVADFGLIKDVQRDSMSMLSGLTPTYAAPEMFDGRPGRFSDQYSLAILYQELLTGTVPFRGRTTAQLASEHLHKAPNLNALPQADRPVIAKCLSKKPTHRYATCREFVDDLINAQIGASSGNEATTTGNSTAQNSSSLSTAYANHESPAPTMQVARRDVECVGSSDKLSADDTHAPKCLFIGVGLTGIDILTNLRERLSQSGSSVDENPGWSWIGIDTDPDSLEQAVREDTLGHLQATQTMYMPLKSSQYYRSIDDDRFGSISRRWLYNIPRQKRTQNVRPLGMLALIDHAKACFRELAIKFQTLRDRFPALATGNDGRLRVYLVASAHGGTGSAMMCELAFMARQIAEVEKIDINVQCVMTVGNQVESDGSALAGANALACLSEIGHFEKTDGLHENLHGIPQHISEPRTPIDALYLIDGGQIGKHEDWERGIESATDYLLTDGCTVVSKSLDTARVNTRQTAENERDIEWTPWIRTASSCRLVVSRKLTPVTLARMSALQAVQRWLLRFRASKQFSEHQKRIETSRSIMQRKKHLEQIDFMVSDLFRENSWTAQAWMRRCTGLFEQAEPLANSQNGLNEKTSSIIKVVDSLIELDPKVEYDLDAITHHLGVSLTDCRQRAKILFDSSVDQLLQWIQSTWLKSRSSWGYLYEMLGMVAAKFIAQGNSLRNVSQRLSNEHDKLIDELHRDPRNSANPEFSPARISELEMQARIHNLSGQLLCRMGEHVEQLQELWRLESDQLGGELASWVEPLAEHLQLRLKDNGTLRDAIPSMPKVWEPVREKTLEGLEKYLEKVATTRLFETWNLETAETSESVAIDDSSSSDGQQPSTHELATNQQTNLTTSTKNYHDTSGIGSQTLRATESQLHSEASATASTIKGSFLTQFDEDDTVDYFKEMAIDEIDSEPYRALIRMAVASTKIAMDEHSLDPASEEAQEELFLSAGAFGENLKEATPKLLSWGGRKRSFLLLPHESKALVDDEQWRQQIKEPIAMLRSSAVKTPTIVCEGEQISLTDVIKEMWMPCQDQWQLANRLFTRTDIDWLPIDLD